MPDPDELNPHDDQAMRAVWKKGWRAFWQGKPPPDVSLFEQLDTSGTKEMKA